MEMYRRNLGILSKAVSLPEIGEASWGYISRSRSFHLPGAVGAHRVDCVRTPSVEEFDMFHEWADGNIAILTLAPEQPEALKLIEHASSLGVIVMYGHHLADIASMQRGLEAGAKGCTHVGNGLPNEIHRHNNPLW